MLSCNKILIERWLKQVCTQHRCIQTQCISTSVICYFYTRQHLSLNVFILPGIKLWGKNGRDFLKFLIECTWAWSQKAGKDHNLNPMISSIFSSLLLDPTLLKNSESNRGQPVLNTAPVKRRSYSGPVTKLLELKCEPSFIFAERWSESLLTLRIYFAKSVGEKNRSEAFQNALKWKTPRKLRPVRQKLPCWNGHARP